MRWISSLALLAASTACQPQPDSTHLATAPGQLQPECRDFRAPLTAGGKPEQATGQACQQPDGSWRVVQNTPGLPAQDYVVPPPDKAAAGATTAAQPPTNQPPCSSFTVPVTVGGQPQQAVVESCQQLDGSWRITQNTQGLPPQVYVVPPPPAEYAYPYPDYYAYPFAYPYWFASPWFFGLGPTIFVAHRFPHMHHGMGHGFHHGLSHGFQPAGGVGGHHR